MEAKVKDRFAERGGPVCAEPEEGWNVTVKLQLVGSPVPLFAAPIVPAHVDVKPKSLVLLSVAV